MVAEKDIPIIFVDDDSALIDGMRRQMRSMLQSSKLHYTTHPHEVLEILIKHRSAVVISDWMMPKMSGIQLYREALGLKEKGLILDFYMIMFTGKSEIDSTVEALKLGVNDFITKPCDMREMIARIKVGIRQIEMTLQLHSTNENLWREANFDKLTDLINRRRAEELLNDELERVDRGIQSLGIYLIDYDHFKRINDQYGHASGDMVLVEVSKRMKAIFRKYDHVCRWGGEEFLIICPSIHDSAMRNTAERVLEIIRSTPINLGAHGDIVVTVSIGGSICKKLSKTTSAKLIENADKALYIAKEKGRNRFEMAMED
jgi:two-component system cell cycle response regulator